MRTAPKTLNSTPTSLPGHIRNSNRLLQYEMAVGPPTSDRAVQTGKADFQAVTCYMIFLAEIQKHTSILNLWHHNVFLLSFPDLSIVKCDRSIIIATKQTKCSVTDELKNEWLKRRK